VQIQPLSLTIPDGKKLHRKLTKLVAAHINCAPTLSEIRQHLMLHKDVTDEDLALAITFTCEDSDLLKWVARH
jgi:hypothetical protein